MCISCEYLLTKEFKLGMSTYIFRNVSFKYNLEYKSLNEAVFS